MKISRSRSHTVRVALAAMTIAIMLAACAAPCAAEVFCAEPPEEWSGRELLEWTIFDVDEGDAMLLRCGGESMLVDGGPSPFRGELADAMNERGLSHIKYMLATHYHDDHINGIYYLLKEGFTADKYLHPYSEWETKNNDRQCRTAEAAAKAGIPSRRLYHGDELELGGAHINVYRCTEIRNGNAKSLMLGVSFGESRLLMCADIIGEAQRWFLEALPAEALSAQLIKLPHHAISAVVPEFLDAVSPSAAVATNRRKQVNPKAVNQLEARGISAFYSGDGMVCAVTDGTDWYIYQPSDESEK